MWKGADSSEDLCLELGNAGTSSPRMRQIWSHSQEGRLGEVKVSPSITASEAKLDGLALMPKPLPSVRSPEAQTSMAEQDGKAPGFPNPETGITSYLFLEMLGCFLGKQGIVTHQTRLCDPSPIQRIPAPGLSQS